MFAGLAGDLYYPKDTPAGKKLPTVIWLHGYSYPLGYMWVYHSDLHPILALVHAGYAVLAYDQSGFGSRLSETGAFYNRYPKWSHMGRLVEDARSAVDALSKDELVDPVTDLSVRILAGRQGGDLRSGAGLARQGHRVDRRLYANADGHGGSRRWGRSALQPRNAT